MKQTKQILYSLLMAIVMMAMSPQRMWAEKTFKILVSNDVTSATLLYDEDAHSGNIFYSMSDFRTWRNSIENITLDPSMADYRPTDCSEWFYGFSGVTTINGLEYLNTSEVTSMCRMFRNCRKLTSLDLSNFDVSKVTNMADMFYECQALSTLTFPASFNTSKVTNMADMFFNCQTLTSLDVSCFDTQEVTNMHGMFSGCQNLTSLSVSSFNTCNVEDMSYLFQNCKNLSSLSLANFNTEKVTTMELMFYNCSGLTSLDLSSFVPKNVTTMKQMFEGCTKLASIDLSNFNTAKVTYMSRMFRDCQALTSLDLSSFNTAKVTKLGMMFYNCYKLKYFKFGNFDMSSVLDSDNYNVVANCNAEDKEIIFTSIPYIKDGTMSIKPLTNVASITYQLDDNSTIFTGATYPPAAATTSATYSHEMSNEYETLVLPFAVTYTADNGNYKLYRLSGTTGSDLYFTEYADGAEIAAGTPMAVKAVGSKNGAGKYEISFAGSGAVNTTITPVTKGSITFTGTYSDVKLNAGAGYNFDGEKFVCTTEQVTESPFRCYITASAEELPAELRLVEHTHTEVTDAEVPATCTTPGHTAGKHCSVCGEVLEGLEEIPALGHDYQVQLDEDNNPVFVWNEGYTTATLQVVCSHDAEHTANVEVTGEGITSADTTPATCITTGVRTYTAKATYESVEYTGTKEEKIPQIPHDFTSHTLTDGPVTSGLYAYTCDYGCWHYDEHRFIKDFYGEGNHLELTEDGAGNYSTSEDIILADANGFAAPIDFIANSVTYTRTGIKNQWGTIVVPFDVNGIGADYDLYKLNQVLNDHEQLVLTKIDEDDNDGIVPAGTPVIFRLHDDLAGDYTLTLTAANTTVSCWLEEGSDADGLQLVGTYDTIRLNNEYDYYISKNMFWMVGDVWAEGVKVAPFRAYLKNTWAMAKASSLSISVGNETNAIDVLNVLNDADAEYYDLNGRRIPQLQKGINIVKYGNGKTVKVTIK